MMRGVGHVPMTDDPALVAEVLLRGSAPAAAMAAGVVPRPARCAVGAQPQPWPRAA